MTNTLTRVTAAAVLGSLAVLFAVLMVVVQVSDWGTRQGYFVDQPVPFSHAHHVSGLGIDCRYCHTSFDRSASAGMPTADTCMNCHSQLYTTAELLEPVRRAWSTGDPVRWRRVHDLADFVYFNHATHVSAGVSCATCHGDVASMPLVHKAEPIDMAWCLDCHRHPEIDAAASAPVPTLAPTPPDLHRVTTDHLTTCTACHR